MKTLALVTVMSCLASCFYGVTRPTISRAAKYDALLLLAGAVITGVGLAMAASANNPSVPSGEVDSRLGEGAAIATPGILIGLGAATGLVINGIEAACGGC